MPEKDLKTIALSRGKQLLLVLGCLLFVALGAWLLSLDPAGIAEHSRFRSPVLVYAVGLTSIVLFGAILVFNARKLFDRRPGMVLDSAGLHDNSSGTAAGFVPWSDIVDIGTYKTFNQRVLVVAVADPAKYLGGGNAVTRYLRKANLKLCGSPITISTAPLKIRFDDLRNAIENYRARYGQHT